MVRAMVRVRVRVRARVLELRVYHGLDHVLLHVDARRRLDPAAVAVEAAEGVEAEQLLADQSLG